MSYLIGDEGVCYDELRGIGRNVQEVVFGVERSYPSIISKNF